jgi:hypothetical protein
VPLYPFASYLPMTAPARMTRFRRQHLTPRNLFLYAVIALALVGMTYGLSRVYAQGLQWGIDWKYTYVQAAANPLNPFVIDTFTNPPWVLLLVPHAFVLPGNVGAAVNITITLVVITLVIRRYGGNWQTLLLTVTSLPFIDLLRTSNVDWIPMLALLLPPMWGLPLLAIKPHTIGAIALIWWKQQRFSLWMFVPSVVIGLLSLVVWGLWFTGAGLPDTVAAWNFAPFPWFVPLGVYLLYRAYHSEDVFLAAAATPFLTPYFATYSITAIFAFVGCKYRREVFIVWCAYWCYFIITVRSQGIF